VRTENVVAKNSDPAIDQRLTWFLEYELLRNAKEVCRRFGISRKTFYKWYKRFNASGRDPKSLIDRPRKPHRSPRRTPESVRAIILDLRNVTGYGPRRLSRELLETKGIQISERTIWKIIKRQETLPVARLQPPISPARSDEKFLAMPLQMH
jgi:transposase